MKDMGLKFLLDDESKMSNTVTSVFLPEGRDLKGFLKDMEDKGYVVYSGKGKECSRLLTWVRSTRMTAKNS